MLHRCCPTDLTVEHNILSVFLLRWHSSEEFKSPWPSQECNQVLGVHLQRAALIQYHKLSGLPTEMYCLPVLEARREKSRCWQCDFLLRPRERICPMLLFGHLVICWQSGAFWPHRRITFIFTFKFTWCSPCAYLFVSEFSLLIDSSHLGL